MISLIVVTTFVLALIAGRLYGTPSRQPETRSPIGTGTGTTPAWRTALARSL
jgi:hypothetical protein